MANFTLSGPIKRHRRRSSFYENDASKLGKLIQILKRRGDDDDDESNESSSGDESEGSGLFGSRQTVYCLGNDIFFRCPVDRSNIDQLVKIIEQKNQQIAKRIRTLESIRGIEITGTQYRPITLHISSNGGSLMDCLIAVDAIRNSKIPIHTVVEGYAASAATVLAMVGKKRIITKNSYMLIHQLSSWSAGKYEELVDDHKNDTTLMNHMKKLYKEYTKMNKKELDEILKHDIWWNSDECLKRGLVDEVN